MWKVSYIDLEDDEIKLKGGFKSDKAVDEWIRSNNNIIPLKLLVWSELLQCYRTVEEYNKQSLNDDSIGEMEVNQNG